MFLLFYRTVVETVVREQQKLLVLVTKLQQLNLLNLISEVFRLISAELLKYILYAINYLMLLPLGRITKNTDVCSNGKGFNLVGGNMKQRKKDC